ncbi:hypothetical protein [Calycomorphotria hydatis]|uniref:Uncharacterized protein n=1 Tax=Calycomorphotria hydatis TaxID=2528027 RepID=A0A517TCJ0_9PLAN|nr:hypothetical protein [Calycomorphotria hydatis]QDT66083.1 hypothetical protein V22_33470 [Calycomorphotria hydatis]
MKYDLCLGSLRIGTVTEADSDFPNLRGVIEYDSMLSRVEVDESRRMSKFIELNCECSRLVDIEDEQDVKAELASVDEELEAYEDLISTDDWHLVSEQGDLIPILCPILRFSNEIVWRWNPES